MKQMLERSNGSAVEVVCPDAAFSIGIASPVRVD
jgi:hypothetical protein